MFGGAKPFSRKWQWKTLWEVCGKLVEKWRREA
jgi:hypothetical protein